MNDSERNKRALLILAVAVVVSLTVYFWPQSTPAADVVEATSSATVAEQRLETVRALASQAPVKSEQLRTLEAAIEEQESALIKTDTAQQAQAEVLQVLRRIATQQDPPVEVTNIDMGQVRAYGETDNYGEVLVSVNFNCAVDQLINMLADLSQQEQAIAVDEIQINTAQGNKQLSVRLSAAGLVPRVLVPERTGLTSF